MQHYWPTGSPVSICVQVSVARRISQIPLAGASTILLSAGPRCGSSRQPRPTLPAEPAPGGHRPVARPRTLEIGLGGRLTGLVEARLGYTPHSPLAGSPPEELEARAVRRRGVRGALLLRP
jgi:hypothetical protein